MGTDHAYRLHLPGDTLIHRLPGHLKLVAALGFVVTVVLTPRTQFWAFGVHAVLLASLASLARIPVPVVLRRMAVEAPFVVFAVLMPFLSTGSRVDVLGFSLSVDGLYGAWNVLAKATLGVVTSIILTATTDVREILLGLERLRLPNLLVQIMTFMIRYGDVVTSETHRMRIARESRGFIARDLRQLPIVARSAGALFIRVYERGERVHLAMLSRGYTGRMPCPVELVVAPTQWATALCLPLASGTVAVTALVLS